MSNQSAARDSIEKFKKELADAKAAGIECGCGCGGIIDFKNEYRHSEKSVCYPCEKCGLLHDFRGHLIFFKSYTKGYDKGSRVEYETATFPKDNPKEISKDVNPKASPCHDSPVCPGVVDTTKLKLLAFTEYGVCNKCNLLHTKTGTLTLFFKYVRGYLRNGKVVFQE